MDKSTHICIIGGAGYVRLVTGLGLSEIGHQVINVDLNQDRVDQLNTGVSPIYEHGIDHLLKRNLRNGRLRFSTDLESSIQDSQVVFIAVGTPSQPSGEIDLSQIVEVANHLRLCMNEYKILSLIHI